MLDDDQFPERQWLTQLLSVQDVTRADFVAGTVLPIFEDIPPPGLVQTCIFETQMPYTGAVDIVLNTGNLLVRAGAFAGISEPWFDSAYALSGGEGVDCMIRAREAGCRFAWSAGAIVHEIVPATRSTAGWMLRRAFRTGNIYAHISRRRRISVFPEMFRIPAGLVFSLGQFLLLWWLPAHRLVALQRMCRAIGKIAGFLGIKYLEYQETHGS
jgi:hypothetical protein